MTPGTEQRNWEAYLKPGEELVWVGAPATGPRFPFKALVRSGMGAVFLLVASSIFRPVLERLLAGDFQLNISTLMPLIFVSVGLYSFVGQYIWSMWVRSRTRYALTNERALIATRSFSRSMKSYPILGSTSVELDEGVEGSVYFAINSVGSKRSSREERIGFEYIKDAAAVYKTITGIQADMT